MPLLAEAQNKN